MVGEIPSQCPNCRAISIQVNQVPPSEHVLGDDWRTRVKCKACEEFIE